MRHVDRECHFFLFWSSGRGILSRNTLTINTKDSEFAMNWSPGEPATLTKGGECWAAKARIEGKVATSPDVAKDNIKTWDQQSERLQSRRKIWFCWKMRSFIVIRNEILSLNNTIYELTIEHTLVTCHPPLFLLRRNNASWHVWLTTILSWMKQKHYNDIIINPPTDTTTTTSGARCFCFKCPIMFSVKGVSGKCCCWQNFAGIPFPPPVGWLSELVTTQIAAPQVHHTLFNAVLSCKTQNWVSTVFNSFILTAGCE